MSAEDGAAAAIARLAGDMRACRICMEAPKGPPLPHPPRPVFQLSATARLCIVGQAPGIRAHVAGRPFADPSGDRLRDWLGIDEATFYDESRIAIIPMGFCFPGYDVRGADLPPRRECAPAWRARVFDLLEHIGLIVVIGQYAQEWHLGPRRLADLTATVANWREYLEASGKGPRTLVLPHPSWRNNGWLKRNPWFAAELLPTLRSEVAALLESVGQPSVGS
ncbi:MAG: uracil-DNA glycosylase family protein [Rhizobiales bacterium]|nr:uracil-DNA glycosylase family protein [Hyphomicrobiales bacterium]